MEKFMQMLQEKAAVLRKLIANTDYMDWLYEFTKEHPRFGTNEWGFHIEKIPDEDLQKVDLLPDFFAAVERYHTNYFVKANTEVGNYSVWYNIKYKDVYFSIGVCVGQGAFNFVARHEDYTEIANETYVELESIIKDTPPADYLSKLETLNSVRTEMKLLVDKLKQSGVPQSEISKVVKESFN